MTNKGITSRDVIPLLWSKIYAECLLRLDLNIK
jgi:hypothetical protein